MRIGLTLQETIIERIGFGRFAVLLCILVGVGAGLVAAAVHPAAGAGAVVAFVAGWAILRNPAAGVVAFLVATYALPFAVVPIPLGGVRLTIVDYALTGVLLVWVLGLMARPDRGFVARLPTDAVITLDSEASSVFDLENETKSALDVPTVYTAMVETPWGSQTQAEKGERNTWENEGELSWGGGQATDAENDYTRLSLSETLETPSGNEYSFYQDYNLDHSFVNSREFYFRRVEDIRAELVAAGLGDKSIWITEFGWATPNNTPGYEYGNQTSFQRQADYIARAFQKARSDYPWVSGMFLWQLNFAVPWRYNGNERHEQASFGVLNGDWSPRPAYEAIKALPKR